MSYLKSRKACFFEAGYSIRFHSRKIEYRHKEHEILIPEIWLPGDGSPHIVIIPEYLLSRRGYPVQVYLYAIHVYCSGICKSQREAAKKTKETFGLEKFAHTTLGRALKRLCVTIEEIGEAPHENGGGEDAPAESAASSRDGAALAGRRDCAKKFLNEWMGQDVSDTGKFETACVAMARRLWRLYQKMLI